MIDPAVPKPLYVVDTNIFMDWQARYYPTAVFVSLVGKIDELIQEKRLRAPALVQEELDAVGTNQLSDWAQARKEIWIPNENLFAETMTIQGQFPGLLDPKAEYEEADAYVIGLAQQQDGIVVTSETPAGEKRKPKREFFIPDVCRELGIPCINLLGLMRREKWTF
ncbi:MAG: DUF4411 family protein [Puniceicoccaceae bacterium]|nr:MAG: DUF4411 family protein [Puniceicoccaceae bacterium]